MGENGITPNMIGAGIENYLTDKVSSGTEEFAARRLATAGDEFEGIFLSLMMKEMRNTLENGGFFGEESSDTYGGIFDLFIGQSLAESSPLGIGEMLLKSYDAQKTEDDSAATEPDEPSTNITIDA